MASNIIIPVDVRLEARRRRIGTTRRSVPPSDWREWLRAVWPKHFSKDLAQHHVKYWKWILSIQAGVPVDPFVGVFSRGGGKTTMAEGGIGALGIRGKRKFALVVSNTGKQADEKVTNVSVMLEDSSVARYYPEHSERQLGKWGQSKGWTQTTLHTAGGFTVRALGLDTAARGIKWGADRPDIIIFDDIDDTLDSPATVAKKLALIKKSILPAGSPDCAVLVIQNLIHQDSVVSQIVDGKAQILARRTVVGPIPAVRGLEWKWEVNDKGISAPKITAGTATWVGQNLATCEKQMGDWGPDTFLSEAQHEVKGSKVGVALRYKPERHDVKMTDDECRSLTAMRRVFGGIDFGEWRFAFSLWAVDENGTPTRIDELFSQRQGLSARAKEIHEICAYYGIEQMPIWGDAANPQDIRELNEAFSRGWEITVEECGLYGVDVRSLNKAQLDGEEPIEVKSRLRCHPVLQGNKARGVGVMRINNALDTGRIRYRVDSEGNHPTYEWRMGWSTTNEGLKMNCSRFVWEMTSWRYPVVKPGEPQPQDPDDNTADGGDMMAAKRYALMSFWGKGKVVEPVVIKGLDDRAEQYDHKSRKFREPSHDIDELMGEGGRSAPNIRSAPSVLAPRRGGRPLSGLLKGS